MKLFLTTAISVFVTLHLSAATPTDSLPYREIPDYPIKYTPETVVARMIDGLGFRYYWATDGLRPQDLSFKPNPEARTTQETLDHILEHSVVMLIALNSKIDTLLWTKISTATFDEKRRITLENFKKASEILKKGKMTLVRSKVSVPNGDKTIDYPFWNQINGTLEDAVWHVGQIVSFRRSSGNPFNPKVNLLTGKVEK